MNGIEHARDLLQVGTLGFGLLVIVGQAAIGWYTIRRLEKNDEARAADIANLRDDVAYIKGRLNGDNH